MNWIINIDNLLIALTPYMNVMTYIDILNPCMNKFDNPYPYMNFITVPLYESDQQI